MTEQVLRDRLATLGGRVEWGTELRSLRVTGPTAPCATSPGWAFAGAVTVGEPAWASVFQISHRIVDAYRHGRVFVAGDAAHIHSPAGGQGMNACIQDVFNLGWKLAAVVAAGAPVALLETYETERRPIGAQVLAGAHALTEIIMGHRTPLAQRLAVARHPEVNRATAEQVSGLAYSYRGHLDIPPLADPLEGLSAGDRVPDVALGAGRQLHHPDHTLLHVPSAGGQAGTELSRQLTARHPGRLQPHQVGGPDTARTLGAPGRDVFCLIRPDGYLALRCTTRDWATLETLGEQTFGSSHGHGG